MLNGAVIEKITALTLYSLPHRLVRGAFGEKEALAKADDFRL